MITPVLITLTTFGWAALVEFHLSRRIFRRPTLLYKLSTISYWKAAISISVTAWLIWSAS